MKPSSAGRVMSIPSFANDHDHMRPTHDAISNWLLRAVRVPHLAEYLLALSAARSPSQVDVRWRSNEFLGIELEAILVDSTGRIVGFADAMLKFTGGVRLWIEIKTEDGTIGALIRQVKSYRHLIVGDKENWLAIVPGLSEPSREFLAHAEIGVLRSTPDPTAYGGSGRVEDLPKFIAPSELEPISSV